MAKVVYTVRARQTMRNISTLVAQPITAEEDSDGYRMAKIADLIEETIAEHPTATEADIYVSSEFIGDSDTSNHIWR